MQDVKVFRGRKIGSGESGQILPMFAMFLVVMILFVSLAIDLGYAYVTKANLSKAVDAAALRGMLNIAKGTTQAGAIAQSVFQANYQTSGRDSGGTLPVPTVTFNPDPPVPGQLTQINVTASTSINTFFARIVPGMQTMTVSDTAQSTRADVMMTLVLDHSRSMTLNGGQQALPPAVANFLSFFSDTLDQASVSSFGDTGSLNVTMEHNFTNDINNFVNGLGFSGGTYAQGGLDNAANQLCGWAVPGVYPYNGGCPVVANTTKVVVFFTDGWANTNYDVLNTMPGGAACGATPVYYGGCAYPEGQFGAGWCGVPNQAPFVNCWIDAAGNSCPAACRPSSFPVKGPNGGALGSVTNGEKNVPNDAMYRAMVWANAMRAQGVIVYAVGLGDKVSLQFLQTLASDPTVAGTSYLGVTGNGTALTRGLGEWAQDCPGPSCSSELNQAFQNIATDILLKITK